MLQSSASNLRHSHKTKLSLAKPRAVTGSEKKPSIHKYAPQKAAVCTQPDRYQSPYNHLPLSHILQQQCQQLWSQILDLIVHDLHLQCECDRSQALVTKARNWLLDSSSPWGTCWSWASPAAVSDIMLAGQALLLSHAVSAQKHLWQLRRNYCKRWGPRCKAAMEGVESLGVQELNVRKMYGICSLQRHKDSIASSSWSLSNEWLTSCLANGRSQYKPGPVSDPHFFTTKPICGADPPAIGEATENLILCNSIFPLATRRDSQLIKPKFAW